MEKMYVRTCAMCGVVIPEKKGVNYWVLFARLGSRIGSYCNQCRDNLWLGKGDTVVKVYQIEHPEKKGVVVGVTIPED